MEVLLIELRLICFRKIFANFFFEFETAFCVSDEQTMSSKSSENLVSKVESYFFEDDDFANLFENFANDNAHLIDENDGENEIKLIYTDLHKKFLVLFEGTLSKFIEGHGATIEDFYEEVRQVSNL